MLLNINLILENNYLEYVLSQCNYFNIKNQKLEDEIIFNFSDFPIIICDNEKNFYDIEAKYFKDKIILLGNHPKNSHPYKINYPLKLNKLISLIQNLAEKKFFFLSKTVILSQNQQLLYNNVNNITIKLTSIETKLIIYLLTNDINDKETLLNHLLPDQYNDQKNKTFDNLIYKLRKKLGLFLINIEVKNNYYYFSAI